MLKQVLVVEGKSDIQRVQQALEVECIATEGFNLRKPVLSRIKDAYEKQEIIILIDPDYAGERIRRFLTKRFPLAQHAFVPREEAYANDEKQCKNDREILIEKMNTWEPILEL